MNKDLAASLIHPLKIGSEISGWTLSQIHIEYNRQHYDCNTAVYTFAPDVIVLVKPIAPGKPAAAFSEHFAISVESREMEFNTTAFNKFVQTIRQNDTEAYQPLKAPQMTEGFHAKGPLLYVVPGHIGNVCDLSHRALQVLCDCDVIFVETAKAIDIAQVDTFFAIELSKKSIIEFDDLTQEHLTHLQQTILAGGSIVLFGACEGAPSLCDPGWKLISWANDNGVPIKTIAGGGALSAAIMRFDKERPFSFWGNLQRVNWQHSILYHLRLLADGPDVQAMPMPMCFCSGDVLNAFWSEICDRVSPFTGRLHVMIDLTCPTEQELILDFSDLSGFDVGAITPQSKLVLRFDIESKVNRSAYGLSTIRVALQHIKHRFWGG